MIENVNEDFISFKYKQEVRFQEQEQNLTSFL